MERVATAFPRDEAASEFCFDFRRIGAAIVQGVSLLWAPSEDAVEKAGTAFAFMLVTLPRDSAGFNASQSVHKPSDLCTTQKG